MGGQSNSFLHLTLATLIFSIKRYLFKSDSLENVLNEQCDALQNIRIKNWLLAIQHKQVQALKVEKWPKLPWFTVPRRCQAATYEVIGL